MLTRGKPSANPLRTVLFLCVSRPTQVFSVTQLDPKGKQKQDGEPVSTSSFRSSKPQHTTDILGYGWRPGRSGSVITKMARRQFTVSDRFLFFFFFFWYQKTDGWDDAAHLFRIGSLPQRYAGPTSSSKGAEINMRLTHPALELQKVYIHLPGGNLEVNLSLRVFTVHDGSVADSYIALLRAPTDNIHCTKVSLHYFVTNLKKKLFDLYIKKSWTH